MSRGQHMAVDKSVVDEQIAALGDFDQWFTKKERNYLHEVMTPGETIHAMTSGLLDGNTWLITVTDKRVLFLDKGMVYGLKQMEMPIAQISAVSHRTGMLLGKIDVSTAGGTKSITQIQKADVPKVAQIISDLVHRPAAAAPPANAAVSSDDVVSQLERLAALKAAGALTDEEFQHQKSKLMGLPSPVPTSPVPNEGWHPDPAQRHELRYCDGSKWTEHVFTDGAQTVDPV